VTAAVTEAATLVAVLADHAAHRSTHPAVGDGARQLSHAELAEETDRVASAIIARRGSEREPVGVLLAPSVDAVVALYGVWKAGKIAVPLDTASPVIALETIVTHAGVGALVTNAGDSSLSSTGVDIIAIEDALTESSDAESLPTVGADDAASIYYTSGSTGRAKGFVIDHGAQLRGVRSWTSAYGLRPDDRIGLLFHHSFGASRVSLYGALLAGAELRVYDVRHMGLGHVAATLDADAVSVAHCAPSLLRSVLSGMPDGPNLRTLRLLVIGAEGIRRIDITRFRQRVWPGCALAYSYAVSEVGPVAALMIASDTAITSDVRVPVGSPLPGKRVEIAAPDREGVGEILVAGDGLAGGYWNDAEQTAQRFDVDAHGEPFFRTGDRGRLRPDGLLEYRGRLGTLVKVRGYTVDLAEVERALLAVVPFDDVAVVAPESGPRARLLAYVVANPTTPHVEAGKLRALMLDAVPAHMIPSTFVMLDALPRTARGKVDTAALPPAPNTRPEVDASYVAPRDDLERVVAAAWASALEIDKVGVNDDFFQLGGDSIAAAEAVSTMQDVLGREVPVAAFVKSATVAAMASSLRGDPDAMSSSLVALRAEGSRPPLFCVHGGGGNLMTYRALADRLGDDQPLYGLQLFGAPARRAIGSMERLAALYVDEIRRVQPRGPHLLAGYSFGGAVAFEMARQLAAAGDGPALVVLIDTVAPDAVRARSAHHPIRRWRAQARNEWKWLTWRLAWTRWSVARRVSPKVAGSTWKIHEKQGGLTKRAMFRYHPGHYDGRVLLLRSEDAAYADRGWAPLLGQTLEVVAVPGVHVTVLSPPFVDVLAERLAAALAAAVASQP